MNQRFAVLAILLTTFAFTVVGAFVGYLIVSGSSQELMGSLRFNYAFIAYTTCSLGGAGIGTGISLFSIWLLGPVTKQ